MKTVSFNILLWLTVLITAFQNACCHCLAVNAVPPEIVVDRQIQTGKSVTAQLRLNGSLSANVLVTEISCDDGLTITDCLVCNGVSGKIVTSQNNNQVNITLIGTEGYPIDKEKSLVDIRLKAVSDTAITSGISVFLIDGTDTDDKQISPCKQHYDIEIVRKATVSGTAVGNAVSLSDNGQSPSKRKTVSQQKNSPVPTAPLSQKTETFTEIQLPTDSQEIPLTVHHDDTTLFITGGLCCLGIVIVIFISYHAGKRQHTKTHTSQT